MIYKYSGDLETIMSYLWDDYRVDFIIQQDWESLREMVDERAKEVSKCIKLFCELVSSGDENAILRFLDTLSDDLMDCLLVELARELHFLKQNEGVVLH